ncbi:helix-turn-helix domain-containing protein [bacterium]|nr:helix-turn-helix domain-containing protein [bacterium]
MDATTIARNLVRQTRPGVDNFDGSRIKQLREDLNMTQENFAHEIGVTFATVNRWENGRTTPNKVAQKVLSLLERKLRKMKRD